MTYTNHMIITARNAEDLNERVAQAIATGWQPFQEITTTPDGLLLQAVVKGGDSEITTYLAIPARNVTDIVRAVTKAVKAGWQPFHEVVFAPDGLMLQAVIQGDPGSGGGSEDDVTWGTLPGKPAVIAAGATAEAARQAIGAGTSDFSGSYDDLTGKPTIPAAPTVDNLSGAGATGRAVMKAADAEAARAAIGAGTSNLSVGTSATDAKAGNYQPTWAQVTGKPAVIAAGATAEAARQAIGAGTSNLTIGTTATDAKAGNWTPDAGVAVADATDETDVVPQLNALLASLRAAGVIAS